MQNDFRSLVQRHTSYIFRREALRKYPLRPTFMYKTDSRFSSFVDRYPFPKLEGFLHQVLLATLAVLDECYKKEGIEGLIIEYNYKPIIIFENYEYNDSPMSLFLHVDLQDLHSEVVIIYEVRDYIVRTKKRIDMMMLGVCFFCISLLCCLHR